MSSSVPTPGPVDVQVQESGIPGCVVMHFPHVVDDRGFLAKVFQSSVFRSVGIDFSIDEVFFSRSRQGVARGLHFQTPPRAVVKIVVCLDGHIVDAVVDVRHGSPTYGEHRTFELSTDARCAVVVPVGCAHGFITTSEHALVGYLQHGEFDAAHDAGIHLASAGIAWPDSDPILSERDRALPGLGEFDSPFRFASGEA